MIVNQRAKRALLGLVLPAAALFAGSLAPGKAFAGFTTCRTDPTVYLSDGHVVVMYADIAASISDVQNVTYVLHVPIGTYATGISYDSTGYLESVIVISDQPWGHGSSDTLVTTIAPSVSVTAFTSVQGVRQGTISGTSGQHLVLSM